LFRQLKSHIKNKSPDNYEQLKSNLDYIIKKQSIERTFRKLF